jgi:hypothetical protein
VRRPISEVRPQLLLSTIISTIKPSSCCPFEWMLAKGRLRRALTDLAQGLIVTLLVDAGASLLVCELVGSHGHDNASSLCFNRLSRGDTGHIGHHRWFEELEPQAGGAWIKENRVAI